MSRRNDERYAEAKKRIKPGAADQLLKGLLKGREYDKLEPTERLKLEAALRVKLGLRAGEDVLQYFSKGFKL